MSLRNDNIAATAKRPLQGFLFDDALPRTITVSAVASREHVQEKVFPFSIRLILGHTNAQRYTIASPSSSGNAKPVAARPVRV
jgi:hypothetical protein